MRILSDLQPMADTKDIVYNALDTMQTIALKKAFDAGVPASVTEAREAVRYEELMLGPVMAMMRRGIKINTEQRDAAVKVLEAQVAALLANLDYVCQAVFGTTVNVNSGPQIKALFYSWLGISEITKSVKGNTKVAADRTALEKIIAEYQRGAFFASHILAIKEIDKQIEFLTKGLSPLNRFHTSYNIAGTETWRLSSNEHPFRIGGNAQNVPQIARKSFEADAGYTLFYSDQQGAEARIVAYLSGDDNYIAAVEGGDSHTMVASMVFGFEAKRELAERPYYRDYSYRDITKKGAHGSNYYGKPYTLAQQMKVETKIAAQFQEQYFTKFPGIRAWHAAVATQLQSKGYLVTPFGMKRTFWGRRWDDATLREAIAFVPQHCVGVLMNLGIYKLWHAFEREGDVQILGNLHDAVLGQVRTEKIPALLPKVLDLLRFPFYIEDIKGRRHKVVIPFDVEIGANWGKASEDNPHGLRKWRPNAT